MRAAIGVVAGYLAWTALWLAGGTGLALAFADQAEAFDEGRPITGAGYLVGALVLSVGCSFVAGLITAAIAKEKPKGSVLTMAVLLLLTGAAVQASAWSLMPVWYHLTFLALLVPVCLLGGRRRAS